jgi:hypothetical protein
LHRKPVGRKRDLQSRHNIYFMAKKKLLKSTQNKVTKAQDTLKTFSNSAVSGNDIILNGIYLVNDSAGKVTLTMLFNNIAIAGSTEVLLDNNTIPPTVQGSLKNFVLGKNAEIAGKFLHVFSAVKATNLTPVPDDLKIDISLSGGAGTVAYPLPAYTLKADGETVNLSISIFLLHI